MERVQVAHIREEEFGLVLVPLDGAFRQRTEDEQGRIRAALQACATTAGMQGVVVPVWNAATDEWRSSHHRRPTGS